MKNSILRRKFAKISSRGATFIRNSRVLNDFCPFLDSDFVLFVLKLLMIEINESSSILYRKYTKSIICKNTLNLHEWTRRSPRAQDLLWERERERSFLAMKHKGKSERECECEPEPERKSERQRQGPRKHGCRGYPGTHWLLKIVMQKYNKTQNLNFLGQFLGFLGAWAPTGFLR